MYSLTTSCVWTNYFSSFPSSFSSSPPSSLPSFSPFFFLLLFLHCYTNQQFFLSYYHRQRRMCWKDASEVWVQLVWDTLLCKVTCHGFFICWYFYVHMRRVLISLDGEKNQHLVMESEKGLFVERCSMSESCKVGGPPTTSIHLISRFDVFAIPCLYSHC